MCHFVLSPDGEREQNVLHNSSNYAIPGRIWIIRDVGKLIVFLHFMGLVRIRSHIASNRSDDKTNPLRDTPHPSLPQSGEGVFEDSLPYSGRVRVGSGQIIVIPSYDPFFVTLNFTKRTAAAK